MNTRRLFSESNIGGHNYLSNMVHLPFYLQNSGLRKVKLAQQTAQAHRKSALAWTENEETLGNFLARSVRQFALLTTNQGGFAVVESPIVQRERFNVKPGETQTSRKKEL